MTDDTAMQLWRALDQRERAHQHEGAALPGRNEWRRCANGLAAARQETEADTLLRTLLQAYRLKRAVDGLNGRQWDASVHWRAEQAVVQLEAQWERLDPEQHLADAETPP